MTQGYSNIEALLGPLRKHGPSWSRELPLHRPDTQDNDIWQNIPFAPTWEDPFFSWLGNPEIEESRDRALAVMDIVPMLGFWDEVPELASGPTWHLIKHRTAGARCNKVKLIGTIVRLKPEFHQACLDIARDWFGSDLGGRTDLLLDEVTAYRKQLNAIGLDCNGFRTYSHLEEGFYPAEIDPPSADRIFDMPVVLADLLARPDQVLHGRIGFFFLAANSD